MKNNHPLVTVIIPCRNEEKTILNTLRSIVNQNYPPHLLEILIFDGQSEDNTLLLLNQFIHDHPNHNIRLFSNPHRTTPYAFNLGLAQARGEIIFTFGAHNRYSPNYISEAVKILNRTDAAAVGSVAVTLPSAGTPIARAIARVLASPFGVGNSLMRIARHHRTIRIADTASCPGYRRAVFNELGTFNTSLVRNHDIEFNLRLRRAGKKIILLPSIKTYYYARARLSDLFRNGFANGYWVLRSTRFASKPFTIRHLVPLLFITALLFSVCLAIFSPSGSRNFWYLSHLPLISIAGSYLLLLLLFSVLTTPSLRHLPCYLIAYPILHFGYGIGSFWAFLTYWRPDPVEKTPLTLKEQKV
ncbi:MAG: glycosyltransferase family 2 protein [bacterium]